MLFSDQDRKGGDRSFKREREREHCLHVDFDLCYKIERERERERERESSLHLDDFDLCFTKFLRDGILN